MVTVEYMYLMQTKRRERTTERHAAPSLDLAKALCARVRRFRDAILWPGASIHCKGPELGVLPYMYLIHTLHIEASTAFHQVWYESVPIVACL